MVGGFRLVLYDIAIDVGVRPAGEGKDDQEAASVRRENRSVQPPSNVNVTPGTVAMQGCSFKGTGMTTSNIFAGFPSIIRSCPGYNPVGNITAPTIGTSPYTAPTKSTDMTVHVTGGVVAGRLHRHRWDSDRARLGRVSCAGAADNHAYVHRSAIVDVVFGLTLVLAR